MRSRGRSVSYSAVGVKTPETTPDPKWRPFRTLKPVSAEPLALGMLEYESVPPNSGNRGGEDGKDGRRVLDVRMSYMNRMHPSILVLSSFCCGT